MNPSIDKTRKLRALARRLCLAALAALLIGSQAAPADASPPSRPPREGAAAPVATPAPTAVSSSDAKAKPAKKVTLKGLVQDDTQKAVTGATVTAVIPKTDDEAEERTAPAAGRRWGRGMQARRAEPHEASTFFTATTDPSGAFLVEAEGEGPFNLRIDAPGFAPTVVENVKAGQGASLVAMKRGLGVSGSVVDLSSSAPVPDAEVLAVAELDKGFRDPDDPKRFTSAARTGRDGSFTVSNLAPGFYTFRVIAAGRAAFDQNEKPIGDGSLKPLLFYLEPGFDVSGRVLDPTGKPLPKMDVRVQPSRRSISSLRALRGGSAPVLSRTDKDGKFTLRGIPIEGKYTIEVDTKDYAPASVDSPAPRGGAPVTGFDIRLENGASVHGKLVDSDQKPVKTDVEVSMTYRDRKTRRVIRTLNRSSKDVKQGAAGLISIERLPSGLANLTISVKGFKDVDKKDVIIGGESKGTDLGTITLDRGKKIAGRVVDDAGKPVPAANVSTSAWSPGSFSAAEAKTDASGKFTLSGLEEGPFTVQASAKGYGEARKTEVSPDKEPLELTLKRAGALEGRIVFGNPPKPIANFRVEANAKDTGEGNAAFRMFRGGGNARPQSDPRGRFSLEGLTPGSYTIVVKADGLQELVRDGIEVRAGETTDAGELALEAGGTLRGKVQSKPEGLPVAGAAVRVKGAGLFDPRNFQANRASSILTDLAGKFEIRGLPAGQTTVVIEPVGFAKAEVSGLTVTPGADSEEILVNVGKGGRIEGRVIGSDGRPKSGSMVTAIAGLTDFSPNLSTVTDDQGRYAIENVAAGTYRVMNLAAFGGEDEEETEGSGRRGPFGGMDSVSADVKDGETAVANFGEKSIKVSGSLKRKSGETAKQMVMFVPSSSLGGMRGVQTATTDDTGRYEVSLSEAGEYNVYVGDQGMRGGTAIKATVPEQPTFNYDIALPEGGIVGRTMDAETGGPLKGVLVYATPTPAKGQKRSIMGGQGARTTSGDDGTYSLQGLSPGSYDMGFVHDGHGAENQTVEVKGTDLTTVDQIMTVGLPFKVRVTAPSGATVPGALVMVAHDGTLVGGLGGMTREDGSFELKQLKTGMYSFIALTREFAPGLVRDIELGGESGSESAIVSLTTGGTARIEVKDAEKKPISGATLSIESSDQPDLNGVLEIMLVMRGAPAVTGADGGLSIEHLPAGKYDVTATKGDKTLTKTVTIEENGSASLTFSME